MDEQEPGDQPKKKRRGHNEGSIYPMKNGGYRGAVFLSYGNDGKPNRKYVLGKTRAEVNRKITTLLHDHQRGVPVGSKSPTVSAILDQWLKDSVHNERVRTY